MNAPVNSVDPPLLGYLNDTSWRGVDIGLYSDFLIRLSVPEGSVVSCSNLPETFLSSIVENLVRDPNSCCLCCIFGPPHQGPYAREQCYVCRHRALLLRENFAVIEQNVIHYYKGNGETDCYCSILLVPTRCHLIPDFPVCHP
jgi:hypothetical protein